MLVFKTAKTFEQKIIYVDKGDIDIDQVMILDLVVYDVVVVKGLRGIANVILDLRFIKQGFGI